MLIGRVFFGGVFFGAHRDDPGAILAFKVLLPLLEGSFHQICGSGGVSRVRQLVASDPEILSRPNKNRSTPFHAACALGELEVAKLLERAHKEHYCCDPDGPDDPVPDERERPDPAGVTTTSTSFRSFLARFSPPSSPPHSAACSTNHPLPVPGASLGSLQLRHHFGLFLAHFLKPHRTATAPPPHRPRGLCYAL